jgi:Holliday junction resolvasome RuvABC endonuclease subunit
MYLGLDLSISQTGYCVITENGNIIPGEIPADLEDFYNMEDRKHHILDSIFAIAKKYKVKYIAIERPVIMVKSSSTIPLLELRGCVLHYMFKYHYKDTYYMDISSSTILNYATGKGAVNKSDVLEFTGKKYNKINARKTKKLMTIKAVKDLYGIDVNSDDAADATILAMMCKHFITKEKHPIYLPDMEDKQDEAIKTVFDRQEVVENEASKLIDRVDKKKERLAKKIEKVKKSK